MPTSSRDFQRAATQRLATAEFLFQHGYNLDAYYLAGYAIECTLKAMILDKTSELERSSQLERITGGKKMHSSEILLGILKDLGKPIPPKLASQLRRGNWSTDLRYESGRIPTSETRGFLKTAQATYNWVKGELS